MRLGRKLDADRVAGTHLAANHHDPHHAGLANEVAILIAMEHRCQQAGLEVIQLVAGIAQSGDLQDRVTANRQQRAGWQRQQINAPRRDVFAHLPGGDVETGRAQFLVQLAVDQMHLAQVGLIGIHSDP